MSGFSSSVNFSPITASLGADVALNNTANYFTGPTIAQGSTGTWFVSGSVTLYTPTTASQFYMKLWDGTTVVASGSYAQSVGGQQIIASLSGYIANPTGNLRIDVRDLSGTDGVIKFNFSGNSKDSTITAIRIA
jgi:hypothetical protein